MINIYALYKTGAKVLLKRLSCRKQATIEANKLRYRFSCATIIVE